jgi:hypothetical protein
MRTDFGKNLPDPLFGPFFGPFWFSPFLVLFWFSIAFKHVVAMSARATIGTSWAMAGPAAAYGDASKTDTQGRWK